MNFNKFVFYTFIGSLLWSILLGYAGYAMGQNWTIIRSWLHIADYLVVAAVIILIAYVLIKRRKKAIN
jgi:membrane protein DedA with SNARE-associated domain